MSHGRLLTYTSVPRTKAEKTAKQGAYADILSMYTFLVMVALHLRRYDTYIFVILRDNKRAACLRGITMRGFTDHRNLVGQPISLARANACLKYCPGGHASSREKRHE
jgi:hypothetical protein